MADDEFIDEQESTESIAPAAAPAEPNAEMAALRGQIAALNDVVQSALTARTPQGNPGGPLPPGAVNPQLRAALRQQGLTDADIDHNSAIVLPYIAAVAPELVALVEQRIGGVDERVTRSEMEGDTETYPYAKTLRSEIKKITADAKKEGRQLSLEAAYHTAVSLNLDKVRDADARRRAESPSSQANVMDGVGHRGSSNSGARAQRGSSTKTADDLRAMTRAERQEYFANIGDVPITPVH